MKKILLAGIAVAGLMATSAEARYQDYGEDYEDRYYEDRGYPEQRYQPRQYERRYEEPRHRYVREELPRRVEYIPKEDLKPVESENRIRPYIGMDFAFSKADYQEDFVNDAIDDDYNSMLLNVGAKFDEYFGAELFYQKSDKSDNNLSDVVSLDNSFKAYGVDFYGYIPICKELDVLASLGVAKYEMKSTVNVDIPMYGKYEGKDDEMTFRLGLGAMFNVTDNFGIRGMVRYIPIDSLDVDHILEASVGVRYSF